jgi:integrase
VHQYVKTLRAFLLWNERFANGQRGLRESIRRTFLPLPRTIFATDEERQRLLTLARPGMRFFILLCADLGLRHKTALSITPSHYNPTDKALTFVTKGGVQQTMPVTPEIALTLEFLPLTASKQLSVVSILNRRDTPTPYLCQQWTALKKAAGVRPELHIHDLRRAAAEAAWTTTKDLRSVQAILGHSSIATTSRYLHNRTQPDKLRNIIDGMHRLRQQTDHPTAAPDTTKTERTQ